MPLQVWETLDYAWINIVLISLFFLTFSIYGIFKLRRKYAKKYLIHLVVSAIITLMLVAVVTILSPKTNNMYYKYEQNMEVIWLTESGWDIIEHYGEKKIVHVRGG